MLNNVCRKPRAPRGPGDTPSRTVAQLWEDYAVDLLREFREQPGPRTCCRPGGRRGAVGTATYPMLWR